MDLSKIYSSEAASENFLSLAQVASGYLKYCQHDAPTLSQPVVTSELRALMEHSLTQTTTPTAAMQSFLKNCRHLQSPRYMGHQVPPPVPLAAAFSALAGLTNQGCAVHEMSPFASEAERVLVKKLLGKVGWSEPGSSGIVTNGGSLATLTALLAARNSRYPQGWSAGIASSTGRGTPILFCSEDTHYSVSRAAGVLGLGTQSVHKIPVNERRQMRVDELRRRLQHWSSAEGDPFCIIGSVCSTATGSFDDLTALASVAEEYGLWLHADAAHGGSLLFSPQHAAKLNGISAADTVVWDAHKMLYVPALCTFLLYKDTPISLQAFQQDAPYLFDEKDPESFLRDGGLRTLECTRQPLALPLWGLWAVYGEALFQNLVEKALATTRLFYEMLLAAPDFFPLHEPECNILCFRYGDDADSDLQHRIRTQLVREGKFYTTLTKLDGRYALRVTVINPLTSTKELTELMDEIRLLGHNLRQRE